MDTRLQSMDTSILRMLELAADQGDVCPSNWDIAEAAGLNSQSAGPRILRRLEKAGAIKVQVGQCSRVVTITRTGKRTAGEIKAAHWRFRPENAHRRHRQYTTQQPKAAPEPKPEPMNLVVVHRDPCPRCGTREDYGCPHLRGPL